MKRREKSKEPAADVKDIIQIIIMHISVFTHAPKIVIFISKWCPVVRCAEFAHLQDSWITEILSFESCSFLLRSSFTSGNASTKRNSITASDFRFLHSNVYYLDSDRDWNNDPHRTGNRVIGREVEVVEHGFFYWNNKFRCLFREMKMGASSSKFYEKNNRTYFKTSMFCNNGVTSFRSLKSFSTTSPIDSTHCAARGD